MECRPNFPKEMKVRSVNQILAESGSLNGACIAVEGVLNFEYENTTLDHWPKSKRQDGVGIWMGAPDGVFEFNAETLARWSGKRVVVLGIIKADASPAPFEGCYGFGRLGLWRAEISPRRVDLYKQWTRDHSRDEMLEEPSSSE